MENIFVEFLPPWVETGLQPAFYDKESGSVLQQTARMYARVNMLIRMFNKLSKNTKTTVEDYINQFNELHDYVHDYFDNLDVQEEINNKIDAMVESGQLQTIIAQYVSLTKVYDTQADLLSDTFITSGFAKTLGLVTKGDGFGAYYEIDETGDLQLASGAYATLISNFGGANYYNFTTRVERINNTTCYITTIPLNDTNGNQINPYVALCNPEGDDYGSPLEYAQNNNTSFTINASLGIHTVIADGEVVSDHDASNHLLPDVAVYLGIKPDRTLVDYQANLATSEAILADGTTQAWLAYYRLIINNQYADFDEIDTEWVSQDSHIATNPHPRQCIGQKNDKTIVILTTDGRRTGEVGLTSEQCADILSTEGCTNAWNLDGGGSVSTAIKGYKINSNIQDSFTVDRKINACLNIKNMITDEELAKTYSQIGKVTQENNAKLMKVINQAIITSHANTDVDTLIGEQNMSYLVGSSHAPSGTGYMLTYPISLPEHMGNYGSQLFIDRANGKLYTRTMVAGTFNDWKPSEGYLAHVYSRSNSYYEVSANDVYETITFDNNIISTNVSGYKDDLITINENSELIFTGNMTNILLEITFDLTTTGVAGNRYVRLESGSDIVSNSLAQFPPVSALSLCTRTITAMCRISQPIKFQIYGKSGDRVGRIRIIARSFN